MCVGGWRVTCYITIYRNHWRVGHRSVENDQMMYRWECGKIHQHVPISVVFKVSRAKFLALTALF